MFLYELFPKTRVKTFSFLSVCYASHFQYVLVEGDRGAGRRENRGQEMYGERKGQETGFLRGQEEGEKNKTLTLLSKPRTQQYFNVF